MSLVFQTGNSHTVLYEHSGHFQLHIGYWECQWLGSVTSLNEVEPQCKFETFRVEQHSGYLVLVALFTLFEDYLADVLLVVEGQLRKILLLHYVTHSITLSVLGLQQPVEVVDVVSNIVFALLPHHPLDVAKVRLVVKYTLTVSVGFGLLQTTVQG